MIEEMGQRLSCRQHHHDENNVLFTAVASGELEVVEAMVEEEPSILEQTTGHYNLSPLHVAAANGRIEVVIVIVFVILFLNPLILLLCFLLI